MDHVHLCRMRSHPWTYELRRGRGLQISPCARLSVSEMPSPQQAVWRSSKDGCVSSAEMPCVKLWKCTAPHCPRLLRVLSFPFLLKSMCIHSCDSGDPETDISSTAERKVSHCDMPLQFSYLDVPFLNASGGGLLSFTPTKLHISIFWPLGFVAQRGSEGEFSLDEPNLLPSLPCCDSKEESVLVDSALWSKAVFHALHGAQWEPALSRLCDCYPEGQCSLLPSWSCLLFSEHCSCSDTESQPQQGSSVPICWQSLVEHLCQGKGHWWRGRKGK